MAGNIDWNALSEEARRRFLTEPVVRPRPDPGTLMAELSEGERHELLDADWATRVEVAERILDTHIAARLAPIEALAEEWERDHVPASGAVHVRVAAYRLRAALAAFRPPHPDQGET